MKSLNQYFEFMQKIRLIKSSCLMKGEIVVKLTPLKWFSDKELHIVIFVKAVSLVTQMFTKVWTVRAST